MTPGFANDRIPTLTHKRSTNLQGTTLGPEPAVTGFRNSDEVLNLAFALPFTVPAWYPSVLVLSLGILFPGEETSLVESQDPSDS